MCFCCKQVIAFYSCEQLFVIFLFCTFINSSPSIWHEFWCRLRCPISRPFVLSQCSLLLLQNIQSFCKRHSFSITWLPPVWAWFIWASCSWFRPVQSIKILCEVPKAVSMISMFITEFMVTGTLHSSLRPNWFWQFLIVYALAITQSLCQTFYIR